jgi:hypothetical protein
VFHNPALWLAAVVPVLMCMGILYAVIRWIARMDANTAATVALTATFKDFSTTVDGKFLDHERRLTRVETRLDL